MLSHWAIVREMKPWNDDAGNWQNLAVASQAPRYEELAKIISNFCPGGSILDIGCGEAVLFNFLPACTRYLGIEPSRKAMEAARARCGPDRIVNMTAEDFDGVQEQWDCVIFNEMLYYTASPLHLVRKFAQLLRPDGIVVISIFQRPERSLKRRLLGWAWHGAVGNMRCTKMVHKFLIREDWKIVVDELVLKQDTSEHWRIIAAKPRRKYVPSFIAST